MTSSGTEVKCDHALMSNTHWAKNPTVSPTPAHAATKSDSLNRFTKVNIAANKMTVCVRPDKRKKQRALAAEAQMINYQKQMVLNCAPANSRKRAAQV